MRFARMIVAVFFSFVITIPVLGQQATTFSTQSSAQALTLLQQSLAVLNGGKSITDITLSGTVRRIAGSDDESGSASLKALSTGESRLDLVFASGSRTEVRVLTNSSPVPIGSWVGPDGIVHSMSQHNLWTDSSWFFPPLTITRVVSSGYIATYLGHETSGSQAVEHISVTREFQATSAPVNSPPDSIPHLAGMDIYLDSVSLLPSSISFNVHPDNDQFNDIPVAIQFSDYRSMGGVQIPFHIQKFFNNSIDLDIQIQNTSINSGLTPSSFNLQ